MWRARPRSPSCQPRDRPRNQKCWPNFPAEPRDHQQSIEHPLELARSRSFRSDDRSSRQRVPLIAGASSRPSHSSACRPRKTVSTPLFLSPRKSILDRAGREGAPAEPLSVDSLTSRRDFFTRAGRSLLSCSRPAGRTERALASAHRDGRRSCGGSTGACGSCGLVALAATATAEQAPRGGRVNRSPLVLVCPSLRSVRWSELLSSAARWRRV